jgi:succinate dehydrogenase / fumarate reductase flavoprotein subunit
MDFANVDMVKEPVPIMPGMHYQMGGVKANVDGETGVLGLYAAGEVACVSVHGGNRLGANSLLDTLVFGRRSGVHAAEMVKSTQHLGVDDSAADDDKNNIQKLLANGKNESFGQIRLDMGTAMKEHFGVFRDENGMREGIEKIESVKKRAEDVYVADKGNTFNTNLLFTLELGFMLECAESIAVSAADRTESRGAHTRTDLPNRDDENWLKHILVSQNGDGGHELSYKDVVITDWEPVIRQY